MGRGDICNQEDVVMIKSLLIIGLGSFCGGALRYYISTLVKVATR